MEPTNWIALSVPVLSLIGVVVMFLGTRGKTQTDYRTAMEARVDKKVSEYMDDLEGRYETLTGKYDTLSAKYTELDGHYRTLKTDQDLSTRRESILYKYIAALREHVVRQLPPPPPSIPPELEEWFDDLEGTFPSGLS